MRKSISNEIYHKNEQDSNIISPEVEKYDSDSGSISLASTTLQDQLSHSSNYKKNTPKRLKNCSKELGFWIFKLKGMDASGNEDLEGIRSFK